MISVKASFTITRKGGETYVETMKMQVDNSTLSAAGSQSGREKLDVWARQLFPAVEKVCLTYMKAVK